MKFVVNTVNKCLPRLGVLKDVENKQQFVAETPLVMLYTRGGSIPHITHEVFKICCKDPQIIQIPIVSTHHFQKAVAEYNGSLSEFVGLRECISCVSVQDPGDLTQPGHRYKDHVPLWTRSGKLLINSDKYMDIIESFKPDMYYCLSDGDTNIASSNKRVTKAVDNTLSFFNKCVERHRKSEVLSKSFFLAPIAGGYCLKSRRRCMNEIKNHELINGFLIDGLHNNGPEVEFLPFEEVRPVIECVINDLPGEKLRAVQGCWNPVAVLKLVQLGVDIFDTSYCHIVTERSSALTFALDETQETQVFEINLREPRYADDFQPILLGCSCLTCTKHSKSYVYHLVTVQELLGPLLIMIHNMHHYLTFFAKIRSCIRDKMLDNLEQLVLKQFDAYQKQVLKCKQVNTEN